MHTGFRIVQAQDLRDYFFGLTGIAVEKSVDSLLLSASNVVAGPNILICIINSLIRLFVNRFELIVIVSKSCIINIHLLLSPICVLALPRILIAWKVHANVICSLTVESRINIILELVLLVILIEIKSTECILLVLQVFDLLLKPIYLCLPPVFHPNTF